MFALPNLALACALAFALALAFAIALAFALAAAFAFAFAAAGGMAPESWTDARAHNLSQGRYPPLIRFAPVVKHQQEEERHQHATQSYPSWRASSVRMYFFTG